MTRKIYTKWILGVIILLIPIVGTYILLYLHTTAPYREESAKTKKLVQLWESEQQKRAQIKGKTSSPQPSAENIIQDAEKYKTNTAKKDNKTTSTEKPTPKMSLFGLGPYPEIPKDWNTPYLWDGCNTIQDELLKRVTIKMHNEGIYSKYGSVGIDHGTGLITPIEYGTVLVEYETNAKSEQVIWSVTGHPDEVPKNAAALWKRLTDIPPHLKVVTPEEISFDPYEYLGL